MFVISIDNYGYVLKPVNYLTQGIHTIQYMMSQLLLRQLLFIYVEMVVKT